MARTGHPQLIVVTNPSPLVQGVELESYLPTPEALLGQEELTTLSS